VSSTPVIHRRRRSECEPHAVRTSAIAIAASALLVLATATPAAATTYTKSCGTKSFYFTVATTGASVDDRAPKGDCGTVAVRLKYNLPIGVTVTTSWVTHDNLAIAYVPAGASIVSADARAGGWYYYNVKKL
jgi:hypothetical protein